MARVHQLRVKKTDIYQTLVWYTEAMGKTPPGQTRERVFAWVRERLLTGRPPTVREVQQAFRFRAVESAREHLEALVTDGRLAKLPGQSRGYSLPGNARPAVLVPLLGRVQAGSPHTAIEDLEGYVPVEPRPSGGDLFALRVRGESMTGAGIFHGDLVIVRKQETAESGDVVVALVGEDATVKRLRKRAGRIELHPENPEFSPLVLRPAEVHILGKVIEVRRTLG